MLPLKTIHTRHSGSFLSDLQIFKYYGLGDQTQHWRRVDPAHKAVDQLDFVLRTIFYLFLCPLAFCFSLNFILPHNCGEGTPQLWGDFTTIVGKVHHNCGAITIKGIKTTFLLKKTTFKEEKTGEVFECICWKWVAREDNFVKNIHRFAGAVRSRHARGASASWARGGRTAGAGR